MAGIFDFFRRRRPPEAAPEERGLAVRPETALRRGAFWEMFRPAPAGAPAPKAEPAAPSFLAPRAEPRPPALRPPTSPTVLEVFFAPAPPAEFLPPGVLPQAPPAAPRAPEPVPTRPPFMEPRYTFIRVPRVEEGWRLPSPEEMVPHLRGHFEGIDRMFQDLRELRRSPEFRRTVAVNAVEGRPVMVRVDPVVYREFYTDMATLLDIPWNVIESHLSGVRTQEDQRMADVVLMRNVIEPMLQRLTEAFEMLKPADLPGWFTVEFDDETGEWWLFYVETAPPGLPAAEAGAGA